MFPNNEGENNIFNFEKRHLNNTKITPSSKNLLFSPTFAPLVNHINHPHEPIKRINTRKKIFKSLISIILIIYLIIFFNFDDILPYKIKQDSYYLRILEEIPNNNSELFKISQFGITKTFLTQKLINKFNSFTELCVNNKLIDNKSYPLLLNPKISIIMPLYKGGKYLYYSLRSIQNQKMKDIEIILIDDNSPDDTLSIINEYMKKDPRIRLIKNEINRKVLFSKSIGALNAKGKYIIQLDQDDIFIRDDVFDILYSEAENNNLDLVQMRDITKSNFHFNKKSIVNCVGQHYIYPKNNQFKKQPELKDTLFINNNIFLLWGLLIRADIYKEAIYKLWNIIVNYNIIFHEDYMVTFMIVILSKNYKYLNKFGLIHFNHRNSASNKHWKIKEYYLGILFFANNLYDFHIDNNPQDIHLAINFMKLSTYGIQKGGELYPNLYNHFINKVLSNDYLSITDKIFLEKNFKIKDKNTFLDSNIFLSILNYQNSNSNLSLNYINELDNNIYNGTKISIVIICDEFKYLKQTLNSIENQNFTNYEIIIIYDNDDDYNLNLIQKYINIFSNIKLIDNYEKKGNLFSISIGILSSKGEYILVLEPGYTLAKNTTLHYLYTECINNNYIDIIEFNLLINKYTNITKSSLSLYKCEHFESKIKKEMETIIFNKNINGIDQEKEILFNKLIKADLLKNIIDKYKLMEYKNIIYNYYDDIIFFILSKNNTSIQHISDYGAIRHEKYTKSLSRNELLNDNNQKIKDTIFYINFLYDNSNDTFEGKEKVLNKFNNYLSTIYNKFNKSTLQSHELYEKFINCKYISQLNKNILELYYHSLIT
jgi:glycosyltransferase involved in cell wall biosynthesis